MLSELERECEFTKRQRIHMAPKTCEALRSCVFPLWTSRFGREGRPGKVLGEFSLKGPTACDIALPRGVE